MYMKQYDTNIISSILDATNMTLSVLKLYTLAP